MYIDILKGTKGIYIGDLSAAPDEKEFLLQCGTKIYVEKIDIWYDKWNEMELCKDCHYKNDNSDLCDFHGIPEEKTGVFNHISGCSRYLRESKCNECLKRIGMK